MKKYTDTRTATEKNWWSGIKGWNEPTICGCVYDDKNGVILECYAECEVCLGYGIPPIGLEELR